MSTVHFFSVCYICSPINIKKLQAEHGLSTEFLKTLELPVIFSDREALTGRDYSVQRENKGMIMMLELQRKASVVKDVEMDRKITWSLFSGVLAII